MVSAGHSHAARREASECDPRDILFPRLALSAFPSNTIFSPISRRACSRSPPGSVMALKEATWGSTAAMSAGYADLSLGGLRKSFSRLTVSNVMLERTVLEGA